MALHEALIATDALDVLGWDRAPQAQRDAFFRAVEAGLMRAVQAQVSS